MSKFNKEQKIEIYRKWKDENISISQLSKAYKMNLANLDYMLRLIDMHGKVRKGSIKHSKKDLCRYVHEFVNMTQNLVKQHS